MNCKPPDLGEDRSVVLREPASNLSNSSKTMFPQLVCISLTFGTPLDRSKRYVAYRYLDLPPHSPRPIKISLSPQSFHKNHLNLSLMICVQVDGLLLGNPTQRNWLSCLITISESNKKHICKSSSKPQVLKHLPLEIHLPWCSGGISKLASGKKH